MWSIWLLVTTACYYVSQLHGLNVALHNYKGKAVTKTQVPISDPKEKVKQAENTVSDSEAAWAKTEWYNVCSGTWHWDALEIRWPGEVPQR